MISNCTVMSRSITATHLSLLELIKARRIRKACFGSRLNNKANEQEQPKQSAHYVTMSNNFR